MEYVASIVKAGNSCPSSWWLWINVRIAVPSGEILLPILGQFLGLQRLVAFSMLFYPSKEIDGRKSHKK